MTTNVIDLEIPDVEPGACRTCRAPLIHGFESHMLDCPVLRGEPAEVVELFPGASAIDVELESAFNRVFDSSERMRRNVREMTETVAQALPTHDVDGFGQVIRGVIRAGFNCGFLFAKARYGGDDL